MEVEDRPSSERLIMPIAMQPPGAAGKESKWSRRQDDHAHFTDEGPRLKLRELRCLTQSRTRIQAIDWGSNIWVPLAPQMFIQAVFWVPTLYMSPQWSRNFPQIGGRPRI